MSNAKLAKAEEKFERLQQRVELEDKAAELVRQRRELAEKLQEIRAQIQQFVTPHKRQAVSTSAVRRPVGRPAAKKVGARAVS